MKLKKTRTDAWGEKLPESRRWQLYRYSKPRAEDEPERPVLRTYEQAKAHLESVGVEPPARPGWYRFLARMRLEDKVQMICNAQASGDGARELGRAAVSDQVAADTFRALSVDAAMNADDKGAALYAAAADRFANAAQRRAGLELKAKAQETKEAELKLAREKFEAAERRLNAAAKAVSDETLTDADRVAKVKSIFGIV